MITAQELKDWLKANSIPFVSLIDMKSRVEIQQIAQDSAVAECTYNAQIAIPPGNKFLMVKVLGVDTRDYHPRKLNALLEQINGILRRRGSEYIYNIDRDHRLMIIFWPENTTCEAAMEKARFGFDRLDYIYRNIRKLDIDD